MRISRIATPCALYDASIAARTFDEADRAIKNQRVSDSDLRDLA